MVFSGDQGHVWGPRRIRLGGCSRGQSGAKTVGMTIGALGPNFLFIPEFTSSLSTKLSRRAATGTDKSLQHRETVIIIRLGVLAEVWLTISPPSS